MDQDPQAQEAHGEGLLAAAKRDAVWGTLSYHLRNGTVTHTVLRKTLRPSAAPQLAAIVSRLFQQEQQKHHPNTPHSPQGNTEENYELVFARFRGNTLTLIAVEQHTLCGTPKHGAQHDTTTKEEE